MDVDPTVLYDTAVKTTTDVGTFNSQTGASVADLGQGGHGVWATQLELGPAGTAAQAMVSSLKTAVAAWVTAVRKAADNYSEADREAAARLHPRFE